MVAACATDAGRRAERPTATVVLDYLRTRPDAANARRSLPTPGIDGTLVRSRPASSDTRQARRDDTVAAEVRLLLSLAAPQRLANLAAACDWALVDHHAREQRLTGRLLHALERADAVDAVPEGLLAAWGAQARRTELGYRNALSQLERLATCLARQGVTPCLLKGPVLVLLGLQHPSERPFGDLDLLVPRERLPQVTVAMRELDYRQHIDPSRHRWARVSHYHDPRWYHPEERAPVEVHWDIARADQPLAFEVHTLATVELELPGGSTVRRLDDADLLSHLCLHFWGDRAAGVPHGIGQLWDVADASAHLDDAGWRDFWQRADRRGHRAVLATVLATARVLLDEPELERFPAVAAQAAAPELSAFAIHRVCGPRPAHVQLLAPYDDVQFGVGRFLKQSIPWAYTPGSPLRWWPSVVLTRLAAAALRSGTALGRIYGEPPSLRLRLAYLWELGKLLGRGLRHPRTTLAELRLDRWTMRVSRSDQ